MFSTIYFKNHKFEFILVCFRKFSSISPNAGKLLDYWGTFGITRGIFWNTIELEAYRHTQLRHLKASSEKSKLPTVWNRTAHHKKNVLITITGQRLRIWILLCFDIKELRIMRKAIPIKKYYCNWIKYMNFEVFVEA